MLCDELSFVKIVFKPRRMPNQIENHATAAYADMEREREREIHQMELLNNTLELDWNTFVVDVIVCVCVDVLQPPCSRIYIAISHTDRWIVLIPQTAID